MYITYLRINDFNAISILIDIYIFKIIYKDFLPKQLETLYVKHTV